MLKECLEIEKITTLEEAIAIIRVLMQQVQELKESNEMLRRENLSQKEEIARLKKDSSTSSKPPSSDITDIEPANPVNADVNSFCDYFLDELKAIPSDAPQGSIKK